MPNLGMSIIALPLEPVYLDARFKTIDEIRLNDLSAAIKVKNKNKFNFRFDEEPQENIEESKIKEAFT